jgi:hypothetical protein
MFPRRPADGYSVVVSVVEELPVTAAALTTGRHLVLINDADIAEAARIGLGSKEDIEAELDAMVLVLTTLHQREPDEAMRFCAGFAARCTELTLRLHRVEHRYREYRQVRTQQVQKVLDACEFQFRAASRQLEPRRQDLAMIGGHT